MGRNVFGSATVDGPGSKGGVLPSPALFDRYRANILGTNGQMYINALIRLKGGAAAIPAFRADLARVTGRSDIDVWNNREFFGGPLVRITRYEAACLLAFALAALVAALFLIGQSVARYTSATVADLQVLQAVGMTPRQAVASATAPPLLAAAAGATLGVAAAIVASRWMPIGGASYSGTAPGHQRRLADPRPRLGPGARPGGGRIGRRRGPGAHRPPAACRPAPLRRGRGRRGRRVRRPGGGGRPVRARARARPGGRAGPAGPARRGGRRPGRARRLHLLGRGVRRRRQPGAVRPDLAAGYVPRPRGQDLGPASQVLKTVAADPDVTGVDDARVAGAQSGQVSVESFTYAPVAGKQVPVVLTAGRMPAAPDEIVLAPTTASDMHAATGSVVRLAGAAAPRALTVTGIGFVPGGLHNNYDDGAWLTPAGYDRLFRGAHFAFKFHLATVALRPGADVQAVAHRLTAKAAAIKGGQAFPFEVTPPPPIVQAVKDVAALPLALSAFLAVLAVGAVGHALSIAVRRRAPRTGRAAGAGADPTAVPASDHHAGEPARRHRAGLRHPARHRARPDPVARRRQHDAAGL